MKYDSQQILEEFYEREKENFPQLSLSQFKDICYGPFRFVASIMESGTLANVRLQYFGTFLVYPKKVMASLATLERRFEKGIVSEKVYKEKKNIIDTYLEKDPDRHL